MPTQSRHPRPLPAASLALAVAILGAAACGGGEAAEGAIGEEPAPAAQERTADPSPGVLPPADGPLPGSWSGATRGPHGVHRVQFVVSDDGRELRDVVFHGHWLCAGEPRPVTAGPAGPLPVENARVAFGAGDPPAAGPTPRITTFEGTFTESAASGTLHVAGEGCDTGRLSWSANLAVE